ncbi:LytR/AlgR family response regulator transcription factor [Emticicia agri]|uniref:LytTR family transcriptional regulator n=1 Tax=Emticicia agri TaxID=2492393 RepID=A0A4Q5M3G4_9BACT|nr:LytTR family DNA-binding domain-containing protein [Emticicia agri]RYU96433.1 LytTR family transcriptional regulator [Emticicia agri]
MKTHFPMNPSFTLRFLSGGKSKYIRPEEIIFLESKINYTILYLTKGRTLLSARNLQVYEQKLTDVSSFFRIHRGVIINMLHIEKIKLEKFTGSVYLHSGEQLCISRRRIKDFEAKYKQI